MDKTKVISLEAAGQAAELLAIYFEQYIPGQPITLNAEQKAAILILLEQIKQDVDHYM